MNSITVDELRSMMKCKDDFTLIDVRQPEEHQETNIGGQLIPLGDLPGKINDLVDHKEKCLVVYCRSGVRSASACQFLNQMGFSEVYNLTGGILAW